MPKGSDFTVILKACDQMHITEKRKKKEICLELQYDFC